MKNIVLVLKILSQTFDALEISYLIGGSVASAAWGEYRSTNDVDIVAAMNESHVDAFVAALENVFYVDTDRVRDALQESSSFNVIYLATMIKADIFIRKSTAWTEAEWERRRMEFIGTEERVAVYIASAEDMILQKLQWYRFGLGMSDVQWRDIKGMLKVQQPNLDYTYLNQWAGTLHVNDLLAKAYEDSGIDATQLNKRN